jgi:hypothetical protein
MAVMTARSARTTKTRMMKMAMKTRKAGEAMKGWTGFRETRWKSQLPQMSINK